MAPVRFVARVSPMKGVENINSNRLYVLRWTDVNEISIVEYETYIEAIQILGEFKEPEPQLEALLGLDKVG